MTSLVLGGASFGLVLLTALTGPIMMIIGILTAIAAIITGVIARDKSGSKTDRFAKIGMWLGIVCAGLAILFSIWATVGLSNWAAGWG